MTNLQIKAAPWIESGNHFLEEQKWVEATHCLLQALKVDPDNASAHSLIAQAYNKQKLIEQAQTSYHSAHKLAPKNPDYLYNLALFYQETKNFIQSEIYYLELLAKQPEYTDALANLGRLYQDTNRPEQAILYYEKDIKLRPGDPDSHFNLAFIHLLTGNYEAGWRKYEWRFQRIAAIINQLDLVITIDTAAAHLAEAMGCPVWVLLPFAPDWRWFLDRTDSPWYPTMRLFRQSEPENWQQPLNAIRDELYKLKLSWGKKTFSDSL